MFEGSDLSLVYGEPSMEAPMYQPQMPSQGPAYPPPPMVQQVSKPPPKQMVSVQQPGDVPYQPPEAMYAQQPKTAPPAGDSFFDRVSTKRYEVFKVIAFALIILFAISMDRVCTFYLTQYITQSILTTTQEFMVRASYPVAVLLVIWIIKAM